MNEFRRAEIRAETPTGRVLVGTVMPYGAVARIGDAFRERFEPGSISPRSGATLNLQHERSMLLARIGAGLEFDDRPDKLTMRADLPKTRLADDVLEGVRAGLYGGLSLEFRAHDERWPERDLRVVTRADLHGVAIVDTPAYTEAMVAEARAAAWGRQPRRGTVFLPVV